MKRLDSRILTAFVPVAITLVSTVLIGHYGKQGTERHLPPAAF